MGRHLNKGRSPPFKPDFYSYQKPDTSPNKHWEIGGNLITLQPSPFFLNSLPKLAENFVSFDSSSPHNPSGEIRGVLALAEKVA